MAPIHNEDDIIDWSLLSGDDDPEHQATILMSKETDQESGPRRNVSPSPARPSEWLKDGASKYLLNNQAMRHLDEDIHRSRQALLAGWMTESELLAAGLRSGRGLRKEDLTDLTARGILQTVGEGATRLYRITQT